MMKNKRTHFPNLLITSLLIMLFSISISSNSFAASDSADQEKEEGSTDFIMHHIADDYQWHIVTIGHTHVTIPLPMIIYDQGEFKFFMSSDFYDEHHEPIAHAGFMISHGKLVRAGAGHEEAGDHGEATGHKAEEIHAESSDDEHAAAGFLNLSITKNVASLFLSVFLMLITFLTIAKRYKNGVAAPKGLQSLFEPIIVFIRDDIAKTNIGEDKYKRFMPFLLTMFFFILYNNLLGLTPGAANLSGNIAVTLSLALFTFFITQFNGKKAYWGHIFATPGVPFALRPIILVVEIIGIFTKPISLTLRLFASITAGHIVVLSIVGLGFILNSVAVGVVGTLFSVVITLIEILVAVIQAYVFTLFSSMYIGQAVDDGHH